jgi:hypothetical protein
MLRLKDPPGPLSPRPSLPSSRTPRLSVGQDTQQALHKWLNSHTHGSQGTPKTATLHTGLGPGVTTLESTGHYRASTWLGCGPDGHTR